METWESNLIASFSEEGRWLPSAKGGAQYDDTKTGSKLCLTVYGFAIWHATLDNVPLSETVVKAFMKHIINDPAAKRDKERLEALKAKY